MSKLIVKTRYGVAPVKLLNDINISLKAKGLFVFIQSKPSNWQFSVYRIAKQLKEGRDSITSALKELETSGYLKRVPIKSPDGKWDGFDYILYDSPHSVSQDDDSEIAENTFTVKSSKRCDRQTVLTETLSKKEISKKETVKKKKRERENPHSLSKENVSSLEKKQTLYELVNSDKASDEVIANCEVLRSHYLKLADKFSPYFDDSLDIYRSVVKYISYIKQKNYPVKGFTNRVLDGMELWLWREVDYKNEV